MGRIKDTWPARLLSGGGVHLDPETGDYKVSVLVRLDRDPERLVSVEISPEVARQWAGNLVEAAARTEELNLDAAARARARAERRLTDRA